MDKEKVIKGLEICTTRPCYCTDCPYKKECCLDSQDVMEDALSLLKEQEIAYQGAVELLQQKMILFEDAIQRLKKQEAIEPIKQIEQTEWTVCGNCHNHIISKWTFCPYCGRPIKWE